MNISAIKYKSFIEQTKFKNEKQLIDLIYKEYIMKQISKEINFTKSLSDGTGYTKGEDFITKPDLENQLDKLLPLNKILSFNSRYIHQVKEFMITFGQPIVDKPAIMPEDRNKLRIALIFEELKEYAEASGQIEFFHQSCHATTIKPEHNKEINLTEQFDALLDLQYVLLGTVLENGFGDTFDEGFDEVHRSNMSKVCDTFDECEETIVKYRDTDKVEVYGLQKNHKWLIKKKSDDKVLKSINYSPANLQPIIDSCIDAKEHHYNNPENPENL